MGAIDNGIIFAYFGLLIAIGIYASRQQSSVEDYFLAGGRLGTVSIACLWIAGWIGSASIIGGAAYAYENGISASWYVLTMSIGMLIFGLFFAARVKGMGQAMKFLTYPELIEHNFDGRTRIAATISTAAAMIGFAAAQLVAIAGLLQILLGWNYDSALLLSAVILVIYTATGGFLAVTYTDWVQVTLLFVGIVIIGVPVAYLNGGTPAAFMEQLPASHFEWGNWGWGKILAFGVSIPLSLFVAMDTYTRCFAAKNEKTAKNGALIAAALLVPLAIAATWLGLTTAVLMPGIENSSNVLATFVVEYFPVGLKGLLIVGLLSALMSTADIAILIASANISHDIYKRFINPDISEKNQFRLSMAMSIVVGAIATLMALRMQNVLDVILIAFTFNSAALFLPTFAIFFMKGADNNAAFWSIALSFTTVLLWFIAGQFAIHEVFSTDPLWPGLAISFIVFFALNRKHVPGEVRVPS